MERSYDTRFVVVCVTTHVPCTSGIDDQVLSAVDKKGLVAKGKAVFARFDDKLCMWKIATKQEVLPRTVR